MLAAGTHAAVSKYQFSVACAGQTLELDFHFCQAEGNLSSWRVLLGERHFRVEHIAVLLEMVYFTWFELGQLKRGADMLNKVTSGALPSMSTFCFTINLLNAIWLSVSR